MMMNHDWRSLLISANSPVQEAIKILDREALRIVLVVDDKHHLLGVVTDGDVRRGLLAHLSLDTPVSSIMNDSPTVGSLNDSKSKLLSLMDEDDLLHIPLIRDGIVAGLETLQHLLKPKSHPNPVFLMAGGFGTRLKPLTDSCPKPLLKVGGKPLLETILESFVDAGFHNFYISTHYLPEKIEKHFGNGEKWGVNISYVHEKKPLGTGGALGLLPSSIPSIPMIVMNGDVLTKVNFEKMLSYHLESAVTATVCVREYKVDVPYGVIRSDKRMVIGIDEKPTSKFFINAGIYVLNPSVLKFVGRNKYIDMPSVLQKCIASDLNVGMFPLYEYWMDVGKIKDFEQAQMDYQQDFV